MPSIENQSNYTLTKLIRTGISPICAMIGTSAYYGQVIDNPLLGSINSSKKILLGLGIIGLANYSKWTENNINPIIPRTPTPITTTTTTEGPPWLLLNKQENQSLMDWDTYISLNAYGISNLINGLTELVPNKFETIRKICNMATGGCLISSGGAMGINNDFNNAYAVPTIIAGASEIIHNLIPMETTNHNEEM
ncbi:MULTISPECIES: hypothetical protein [unclassified Spiroplasma]|uniref:hypothetical protein n=1 Tax=unclassified Spiroplasma TaxID=2637901 RepID=UPI0030CF329D